MKHLLLLGGLYLSYASEDILSNLGDLADKAKSTLEDAEQTVVIDGVDIKQSLLDDILPQILSPEDHIDQESWIQARSSRRRDGDTNEDSSESDVDDTQLLGGDMDEHGCIGSAGFTWCEGRSECVQTWLFEGDWVEECTNDSENLLGDDKDDHDCITSAGFTWCEVKGACVQSWLDDECNDDDSVNIVGDDRDDNDCIASAGYTWCEKKNECVRSWMLEGEWDDECTNDDSSENLVGDDSDDHDCVTSAGYTWCEKQSMCVRLWELEGEYNDECVLEDSSGESSSSDAESSQQDWEKFFYDEDGNIKPWVFRCFLSLTIMATVLVLCLIRVKRMRNRRRRQIQMAGIEMLVDIPDNYERFSCQETVAVKETAKEAVPDRKDFTNLV